MKEIVLRHYFEGFASVDELAADVEAAFDRHTDGAGTVRLHAVRMEHDFIVTTAHLCALVAAVRAGQLTLLALDAICFCLESSDAFHWDNDTVDGARVANAICWLGTPEINYQLTPIVLEKIEHYLTTGEDRLSDADVAPSGNRPHLLSLRQTGLRRDV